MKKLGLLLLSVAVSASVVAPVASASSHPPPVQVTFEGNKVQFPIQPAVVNSTLMVPMRKIFEIAGARITWDNKKKEIVAYKGDRIMRLTLNKKLAFISGNGFQLDAAPYLDKGSMLVPLRFVSESLGLKVKWDEPTRTAHLTDEFKYKVLITDLQDHFDKDAHGDVSGVSLKDLEDKSATRLIAIPNNGLALITQQNPTVAGPNAANINLNGEAGKESKALISFDAKQLKGKHIKGAYIRLVNTQNLDTNEVRSIQVRKMLKPWTLKATWKTPDGVNEKWEQWGAAGASDASMVIANQSTFRIVAWEPSWFLNVTNTVKGWVNGEPNNGFMLTSDRNIGLFNPFTAGFKPQLIVEYADSKDAAPLTYKRKLQLALDFLGKNYNRGPWSDSIIGVLNSQINADKLGLDDTYLKSLTTFFNDYVTDDGGLKNGAVALDSYYKGAMGKALIYMHQRTGEQKYKVALDKIRHMFETLPVVDGIYTVNETYQSELAYLGTDFLAAYDQAYGDRTALNIAMEMTIATYDELMNADTNGIPYTLKVKTEDIDGFPKGVGWGRGIGWLYAGMAKMLQHDVVKKHPQYPEFTKRFRELSDTLRKYQTGVGPGAGLWRNLIQDMDTRVETTGTAMIAYGMEVGLREGVLDPTYELTIANAVNGLQHFTLTGAEMGNAFPSNQDLQYTYPYLTLTINSFGFWMELLTTRELYRK